MSFNYCTPEMCWCELTTCSLPAHYLLTTCSLPAPGGDDRNLHVDLCLDSFGKHWMEKRKMMRVGVEWQCSGREACMGSLRSWAAGGAVPPTQVGDIFQTQVNKWKCQWFLLEEQYIPPLELYIWKNKNVAIDQKFNIKLTLLFPKTTQSRMRLEQPSGCWGSGS